MHELVIKVKDGTTVYGIACFDFEVRTQTVIAVVNDMIDAFRDDKRLHCELDKYELAIDLLEATSARLAPEELKAWEKSVFFDENHNPLSKKKRKTLSDKTNGNDRNGEIFVTQNNITHLLMYYGYSVAFDITSKTIDLAFDIVDKETILDTIDLDENAEIFDHPDYLPALNVSEDELHSLSFDKFRELGEQIVEITEHELISFAKLNEDNKYVAFHIDDWVLTYYREGFIEGFMPFEMGRMLYCENAEEYANTLSKIDGRSPAFGRKVYSKYQKMRIDYYELVRILKQSGCQKKFITDLLMNRFGLDRVSADNVICVSDEDWEIFTDRKYRYARMKTRKLLRQGLKEWEIVDMVSGLFRLSYSDVYDMIKEIALYDRENESVETIEAKINCIASLCEECHRDKEKAYEKIKLMFGLTDQEFDSIKTKKIKSHCL